MIQNLELAAVAERMLAIFYGLYGTSLLVWPAKWREAIGHMISGPQAGLRLCWGPMIAAAVLISMHNVWDGSPRVVITVIGWLVLVKAALFMLAPEWQINFARKRIEGPAWLMRLAAVFTLLIAGLSAWYGFGFASEGGAPGGEHEAHDHDGGARQHGGRALAVDRSRIWAPDRVVRGRAVAGSGVVHGRGARRAAGGIPSRGRIARGGTTRS